MPISKAVIVAALAVLCIDMTSAQSTEPPAAATHPLDLYAKPQRLLMLPNGGRMNILCTGSGSPTVLLEAGAGYSNWIWTPVQRGIARTNRVCSYDRAGMGFSELASEPRTPANIASDLTLLLQAADVKGPYVVVGHSIGGTYARAFTDLHRKEIIGMVLIEPVGINQDKRFEEEIPGDAQRHAESRRFNEACAAAAASGALQRTSPPESIKPCAYSPWDSSFPASFNAAQRQIRESPDFFRTLISEGKEKDASEVSAAAGSYGDMPLIVLTASNSGEDSGYSPDELAKFNKIWNSMHEEIAVLSSRGVHRQVPGASHNFVIIERPGVIVAAIAEVVAAGSK